MNPSLPLLASLWLTAYQVTAWPVTVHLSEQCVVIANDRFWLPGDSMIVVYDDTQRVLLADGLLLHQLPGRRTPPHLSPRIDWLNAILRSMRTREHLPVETQIRMALAEVDPTGILDPGYEPRVNGCDLEVRYVGEAQTESIHLHLQPVNDRPSMTPDEYARQYLEMHARRLAGSDSYAWIEKEGAEMGTMGVNADRIIALLKSRRLGEVDPAGETWLAKEFGLELRKLVYRGEE